MEKMKQQSISKKGSPHIKRINLRRVKSRMEIKCFAILLICLLTACFSKTSTINMLMNQRKKISIYLQTANHLNEKQKQAMMDHQPFMGMTFEEVCLAMHLDDITVKLSEIDIPLQAVFTANNISYVIYFDGGTPNRILEWSSFPDGEAKEVLENLHKSQEHHLGSPLPQS